MKHTIVFAVAALLAVATSAYAEPVFTTTGTFTSSGTNSLSAGGGTLTFTGISLPGTDVGLTFPGDTNPLVVFGTWTYSGPGQLNPSAFTGQGFTLQITQVDPSSPALPPQQSFFTGGFITPGGSSTDLVITLNPIVTAPSNPQYTYVVYSPQNVNNTQGLMGSVTRGLNGPVVPLPLAAVAGTGLFGLVGASRFIRRRAL